MKPIISLVEANIAIVAMCNERKEALNRLLNSLDQYALSSLSPNEYSEYVKIKQTLIKRYSQHENS